MKRALKLAMSVIAGAMMFVGCSRDDGVRDEVAKLRKDVDALQGEVKRLSRRVPVAPFQRQGSAVRPENATARDEVARRRAEHMQRGPNMANLTPEERKARMEERRRQHEERKAAAQRRRGGRVAAPAPSTAATPEVPAAQPSEARTASAEE